LSFASKDIKECEGNSRGLQRSEVPLVPHATRLTLRERLLERVALRVRVAVDVLVRVRLIAGVREAVCPAVFVEERGAEDPAREAEPLGGRDGEAVVLASTERLADAGRDAEAERGGVRLTDGDAEEEDEEDPEAVSELELLEVPVLVEEVEVLAVGTAVCDGEGLCVPEGDKVAEPEGVADAVPDSVEAAVLDGEEDADPVREKELLGLAEQEGEPLELRVSDELVDEDREELRLSVALALAVPELLQLLVAVALGLPESVALALAVTLAEDVSEWVGKLVHDEEPVLVAEIE